MDKYLELKEKFEANRDDENAVKIGGVYEEFVFYFMVYQHLKEKQFTRIF